MHLVDTHGRVFVGAEAAVRSLASRPVLGRLALVYYVPGVRLLADTVYGGSRGAVGATRTAPRAPAGPITGPPDDADPVNPFRFPPREAMM
jgi:hypothetical protein